MIGESSTTLDPRGGSSVLREELLRQRYLLRDSCGRVLETPGEMFHRVASAVAMTESGLSNEKIRRLTRQFKRVMANGLFLPNSPALMNAGREGGLCSACFVLPVEDSIPEIFASVRDTALVQKLGGGTGFSFDRLRPTGDLVPFPIT